MSDTEVHVPVTKVSGEDMQRVVKLVGQEAHNAKQVRRSRSSSYNQSKRRRQQLACNDDDATAAAGSNASC